MIAGDALFRLNGASRNDPAVEQWLSGEPDALFAIARELFSRVRRCGDDVRELIHDGCPTACVEDAAFAYVNVFKEHVSIGFFTGAFLEDPEQLLQGTGKRMRHVKVRSGIELKSDPINQLIAAAYADVRMRLKVSD